MTWDGARSGGRGRGDDDPAGARDYAGDRAMWSAWWRLQLAALLVLLELVLDRRFIARAAVAWCTDEDSPDAQLIVMAEEARSAWLVCTPAPLFCGSACWCAAVAIGAMRHPAHEDGRSPSCREGRRWRPSPLAILFSLRCCSRRLPVRMVLAVAAGMLGWRLELLRRWSRAARRRARSGYLDDLGQSRRTRRSGVGAGSKVQAMPGLPRVAGVRCPHGAGELAEVRARALISVRCSRARTAGDVGRGGAGRSIVFLPQPRADLFLALILEPGRRGAGTDPAFAVLSQAAPCWSPGQIFCATV